MKERRLQTREIEGRLILFRSVNNQTEYDYGGMEEEYLSETVTIEYDGGKRIHVPSNFEIIQTEDGDIAFIEVDKPLPIPYYTVDGITAINEITDCKVFKSKEKEHWVIPSVPRRHYIVLENGMVVDPNPYKYGKRSL